MIFVFHDIFAFARENDRRSAQNDIRETEDKMVHSSERRTVEMVTGRLPDDCK